jgi:hypothetical protein
MSFLYIFLEFEGITLNHDIQIPHRRSAGHIPYRAAHQKHGKSFGTSYFTDCQQRGALRMRKAIFEQVDVVGHNWYFYSKPVQTGTLQPVKAKLSYDESSVYNGEHR